MVCALPVFAPELAAGDAGDATYQLEALHEAEGRHFWFVARIRLIEWAIRRSRDTFARGATLIDPNIAKPQQLWLVRSIVNDGRREEKNRKAHEQLSIVISDSLGLRSTSPAYLLTCTTPTEKPERLDRKSVV